MIFNIARALPSRIKRLGHVEFSSCGVKRSWRIGASFGRFLSWCSVSVWKSSTRLSRVTSDTEPWVSSCSVLVLIQTVCVFTIRSWFREWGTNYCNRAWCCKHRRAKQCNQANFLSAHSPLSISIIEARLLLIYYFRCEMSLHTTWLGCRWCNGRQS